MSIENLIGILPPPVSPLEVPSSLNWENAMNELVTNPPVDSANENINLAVSAKSEEQVLRELKGVGEKFPYPIYPEPGGCLPSVRLTTEMYSIGSPKVHRTNLVLMST